MKIALVSDIHVEFDDDKGEKFFSSMALVEADVLVVAGDIHSEVKSLIDTLRRFGGQFPNVVAVLGNHDVWGSVPRERQSIVKYALSPYKNVHLLDRSSVDIDGVNFSGCTLWADPRPRGRMTMDMRMFLGDPDTWMLEEHLEDVKFVNETVTGTDVLVTHFLPHINSVDPKWLGSSGNWYFHVRTDESIDTAKSLVLHGHTHDPCMWNSAAGALVVCNPRGYPSEKMRDTYAPKLFETINQGQPYEFRRTWA